MTAALESGEWSAARPGCTLLTGKTRYPFYRRVGGPQAWSGRTENLVPTGIRSRTVQPVVSRYTDWATRPSLAGRISYGTDDRWFLSVARDCLFFKASRLSLEGTQPSVEGKRGGLSRESNRSEAWSGILAFTSVEMESARSFTTRPLLLHGVVLNKAPVQLAIPYALPVNVFFYIKILSRKLSAVFLWGTEFHIDMKWYAELQ